VATNVPGIMRELSLQDCIELALKHNLDLQIDRLNPLIAQFGLQASYGPYDPTFSFSGSYTHNEGGTTLLNGTLVIPGSTRDIENFNSVLSGLLPWGTMYSLGMGTPFNDTTANIGASANDFNRPQFFTTNTVFSLTNGLQAFPISVTNYAPKAVTRTIENASGSIQVNVTQPLLKNFWMNSSQLAIRVAKNRLKYSEQTLRLQLMQTMTSLEKAYNDLIYYRQNVEVQQKAVELAEQLVRENRKRLEVGALAPLDLQSAEAQAASTRAAVIAARSQLGTQERLVKSFISDQYMDWATVPIAPSGSLSSVPPIVNVQDSWNRGITQRPELLQAKLDVEKQGIQLKYDKNQLYPELDVFGTFGYNGTGTSLDDVLGDIGAQNLPYYTVGGQISFPLANQLARNTYKSDKEAMEQFVLTVKKLEQSILINIDNDIGTLRANFDQVQATKQARQYEESALDAEQKKLESGKSTTYTVLQVQRDLTTARGNEIQALDTFNNSLSQLSIDEGSTLERLHVKLEVK
jgi:outer membrane protein TolC